MGAVEQYAPKDDRLKYIAREIEGFALKYPKANVNLSRGNLPYYHEHSVNGELIMPWVDEEEAVLGSETDQYKDIMRSIRMFSQWIYAQLESDNDYWHSNEAVDERISGLYFTKGGLRSVRLPAVGEET
jgi:hypothetical protein